VGAEQAVKGESQSWEKDVDEREGSDGTYALMKHSSHLRLTIYRFFMLLTFKCPHTAIADGGSEGMPK